MAGWVRLLLGLALLPACWAFARAAVDAFVVAAGKGVGIEALSFLGGMLAFVVCWLVAPHPVRTYVLGHELTHALWGLFFGARPSDLKVGAAGGSVRLSKTNVFITLSPYFFPFYAVVVLLVAVGVSLFVKPLPCLPLWLALIGFTWSFHLLFTLETLMQRQPDVHLYGRLFSWTFIFLANTAIVLVWLAATTVLTFAELGGFLVDRILAAYVGVWNFIASSSVWLRARMTSTSFLTLHSSFFIS